MTVFITCECGEQFCGPEATGVMLRCPECSRVYEDMTVVARWHVSPPPVLVGKPGPAAPIPGPVGPYPFAAEMAAFERRFGDALRAAGVDTDEYVALDSPGGKACLDGHFTSAELRTIADVMDALAKEPR